MLHNIIVKYFSFLTFFYISKSYADFTQKYPDMVFRIEFFSIFANII